MERTNNPTTKTILINPQLLKQTRKVRSSSSSSSSNKQPPGLISNAALKSKLSKRAKQWAEHSSSNRSTANAPPPGDEFKEAVQFFSQAQTAATKSPQTTAALPAPAIQTPAPALAAPAPALAALAPANAMPVLKSHPPSSLHVQLNLPSSLEDTGSNTHFGTLLPDVPFGCLKGGTKPSYRTWNQTRKNMSHLLPATSAAPHSTPPRLSSAFPPTIQLPLTIHPSPSPAPNLSPAPNPSASTLTSAAPNPSAATFTSATTTPSAAPAYKKISKRTTKKSHSVGKHTNGRIVGVLLKDNKSRKHVLATQQQLKSTDIMDIKRYLLQHGLIRAGTTCPPHVLRHIFEAAMLAGDVTNINCDTLLHNLNA